MSIRLIQLHLSSLRRLALVEEPRLELLEIESVHELLNLVLNGGMPLLQYLDVARKGQHLNYDDVYSGNSDWKILPSIDHPEPARLFVTGTGLTHLGSAKNRNAMHEKPATNETDSMKIFRWGVERGKPAPGEIGVAPEWFYKGPGTTLRGHNQPLEWPAHADDGGEEAEIVGVYFIDATGTPVRVGMTQGNEFSDHVFEKKNYLNLAGSKLRTSSLGPELIISPDFTSVPGTARVLRGTPPDNVLWTKPLITGEAEMSHSLANIEHHHFKFAAHRRPGDIHVHFFGTCALSYADGIKLQNGDIMEVSYNGFGRPLRNPLSIESAPQKLVTVKTFP